MRIGRTVLDFATSLRTGVPMRLAGGLMALMVTGAVGCASDPPGVAVTDATSGNTAAGGSPPPSGDTALDGPITTDIEAAQHNIDFYTAYETYLESAFTSEGTDISLLESALAFNDPEAGTFDVDAIDACTRDAISGYSSATDPSDVTFSFELDETVEVRPGLWIVSGRYDFAIGSDRVTEEIVTYLSERGIVDTHQPGNDEPAEGCVAVNFDQSAVGSVLASEAEASDANR